MATTRDVVAGQCPATLDPAPEPAETSGMTTRLIVGYVRERGGDEAVTRLLDLAGVPASRADLEDSAHWVSYSSRISLLRATTQVLDDPSAAHAIGAQSLRTGMHHALVLLLRALGSPARVYRQLPRSVPKFSTTSTLEVVECGTHHATLRFRLHDGYEHSRLDCAYAQGLMSVVPEIFGLPPARLVHDECQSDGYAACLYHLTWSTRRRWLRRRPVGAADGHEVVALRGQLEELQSAAAELVSTEDIAALLERITVRAASAVLAPSYLLALHPRDGGPPLVRSRGIPDDRAQALAARLLAGADLGDGAVVVEVESSRHVHGRLAALYGPGQRGPSDERPMLRAYAGHAASALDLLHALERSQRGESRAEALLSLAHDLRSATEPAAVARAVAGALPGIVGCDTATVFGWDEQDGRLHPIASAGLAPGDEQVLRDTVIEPYSCPELSTLLAQQGASVLEPETAAPVISGLVDALGLSRVMYLPLLAGGEVLGVAAAGWRAADPLPSPDEPLTRLQGIADYAATAMQNARLLGTVRHQAGHDALTQLPNRTSFGEALARALQRPEPHLPGGQVAVLYCDLDGFKQVNDALGHAAGDELLRQVAVRLRGAARPEDVVARLGGDEFALILRDVPSHALPQSVAEHVVAALGTPFRVEGLDLRVTASVGVAVQWPGADPDALLRSADGAMYAAKKRGRNQVARADRGSLGTTSPGVPRAAFEEELRVAAGRAELRVHLQRIVRLDRGDVADPAAASTVGVEALVRWQHPRLGLLAPAAFLPLAEQSGVVVDIDLWAVRAACAALAAPGPWTGDDPLHLAVNVSARTLVDPRLYATVREALADARLDPRRLYVEVVESRSLLDLPGVVDRLSALRRLGVRVSLDDFGTGYSTLSWLQQLPVDQVKLDRAFTAAITHDPKSRALAEGVLALARTLGVEVVAEGVETLEQAVLLRDAGFTRAQGYLWGLPHPTPGTSVVRPGT